MTRRDEIVEAGAEAMAERDGLDWPRMLERSSLQSHESKHSYRLRAAAMLDAITKGAGLKLMGWEPPVSNQMARDGADWKLLTKREYQTVWDAAPWVPEKKP